MDIIDTLFQIYMTPFIILSIVGIVYMIFALFIQYPFLYLKENFFNNKKPKK